MKCPRALLAGTFSLLLSAFCPVPLSAQNTKADKAAEKTAKIKALVDAQNYDFIAQSALPMTGRTRQLTPDYDLQVSKTAIVSYLPYFGRAYSAPFNPSQGPTQFTSKDFEYTINPGKKSGWDVQIRFKDNREVQQMSLGITESGYATLQVTYLNRQPMSFSGYIKATKPKKPKHK